MKPKRPRPGQVGYRPRKSGTRARPNVERLQADAARLERRYTTKPRQGKKKE